MLIDAHIHIAASSLYTRQGWEAADLNQRIEWVKEIFRQYKKQNIYALRDGGDVISASLLAREIAPLEGIIYKSPIYALYRRGCYGSFIGRPIEDICSFKEEFKNLLSYKPDHLKVILTGLVSFEIYGDVGETAFTYDELKYMVEEAHSNGIPVMAHANGREGVGRAVKAGVDTIEHGYLMTAAELNVIAEKDIVWVPTLTPLGNIIDSRDERFTNEIKTIQKVYDSQVENIRIAAGLGVKIALGSDAGAYKVGHGSGLIDEINHFIRAGFCRYEIEKMCSENGARALLI